MFTIQLFGSKFGEAENVDLADEASLTIQWEGFQPSPWFKKLIDEAIQHEFSGLDNFEYIPDDHTIVSLNIVDGMFIIWSGDNNDVVNEVTQLNWADVFQGE